MVVMVTVVDHSYVKLVPMDHGNSTALSVGVQDVVMLRRGTLSLQGLPNSETGSISRCQDIK